MSSIDSQKIGKKSTVLQPNESSLERSSSPTPSSPYSVSSMPSSPSSRLSSNPEITPVSSNTESKDSKSPKSKAAKLVSNFEESSIHSESTTTKKRKSKHTFSTKQFKIFRNLLLLEQNLRIQYAQQQSTRNKFFCFYFSWVCLSILVFLRLYFATAGYSRNDRHSSLNEVYDTKLESSHGWPSLKLVLVFQLITLALFHISGEYQRTIILPKKFLFLTNKSLRQLNLRLIKLPKSYIDQFSDALKFCLKVIVMLFIKYISDYMPCRKLFLKKNVLYIRSFLKILKILKLRLVLLNLNSSYDQINLNSTFNIKLSLNSRVFNPNIRESWELFRNEFWMREYNRRFKLIYGINYDTDITAIEKMVLNNELVNKTFGKISNNTNAVANTASSPKAHSMSPSRTPARRRMSITSENSAITPLTAQMLKTFESQSDKKSRSLSPAPPPASSGSNIMNKIDLVRKDRDDRKERRKSQISNFENFRVPSTPPTKSEAVFDESQNTLEDMSKIQSKVEKRIRRRYS